MIDTIVVIDTETTGTDPEKHSLLEVAWVPLLLADKQTNLWQYGHSNWTYIEYIGDIPPEARAVHHISPDDVAPNASNCMKDEYLLHDLIAAETGESRYAAHNAKFDSGFLPELSVFEDKEIPWICTYRCAKHLYPDAPSYGNQVLRYWLGIEPDENLLRGFQAHRAMYDTAVTAAMLLHMLQTHTAEQLVELSATPVLLRTVHFGKHRGALWSDVPHDYLNWLMYKSDQLKDDEDLRHTVNHYYRR